MKLEAETVTWYIIGQLRLLNIKYSISPLCNNMYEFSLFFFFSTTGTFNLRLHDL